MKREHAETILRQRWCVGCGIIFIFAAPVTVGTVIAVIHAVNNLGGGNGCGRIGSTSNPMMDGQITGIVSGTTEDDRRKRPPKRPFA